MNNSRKLFVVTVTALLVGGTSSSLIGFASSARAGILAQHLGAADPTTEGWVLRDQSNGEHIFAPVFNDLGTTDAWKIDTSNKGGDGEYDYYLNSSQLEEALSNGWRLQAQIRFIEVAPPAGHAVWFRADTHEFYLHFGITGRPGNPGDLVVRYRDQLGPGQVTVTGDARSYHDYELRDTDADGLAELIIDGTLAATNIVAIPQAAFAPAVIFGDFYSDPSWSGNGNYARVVFESVPEPAAIWLTALAAFLLCGVGRSSSCGG